MASETRQALRALGRVPGFTAVVLVTFALGIGATTAIYSVVSRVLLRPLPLPDADRLVTVWTRMPDAKIDQLAVAHAEYLDYRAETRLMDEVGAYTILPATLTGAGEPAKVRAGFSSASLWAVVGIRPELGRTLQAGDDVKGAERVAVLSHGLWQSRFAADPGVLGRTVELDGRPCRVVGVLPPAFDFTQTAPDIWVPYVLDPTRRDNHHLLVIGRMKPGVSVAMLQPEMDAIVGRWAKMYTHAHPFFAIPLRDAVVGGVRATLAVLFAAAALVLLVAAANVAGLLLARGEARQRELAVRAAVGAGRAALARQVLGESLILALFGGALGLLAAKAGLALILALQGGALPQVGAIGLDLPVLLFAFAASLLAGVLAGLPPAWRASRPDVGAILKGSGERTAAASGRQNLRGALVVVETAAAVVLVSGSALLLRGLWKTAGVSPGIDPDHVLAAQIGLPAAAYPKPQDVTVFYDRLLERLGALPGVRSAALVSSLPMRDDGRLVLVGGPWQPPGAEPLGAEVMMVTPDYFKALGERVLRGRPFTAADRAGSARVAVLNETAAGALLGGRDPVGTPLTVVQAQPREPAFTVVGVVADVPNGGLGTTVQPQVFLPLAQGVAEIRGATRNVSVALKTAVDPASLGASLRGAVRALDPKLAVANVETMDRVVSATLGSQRFNAVLLGSFAGVALVLAVTGLYGLLAYAVGLRRREFGIRLAMGARPGQLLAMVLRQGVTLAAAGVAAGTVAGAAAGRVIGGLVHGAGGFDAACVLVTAAVLLATAAAASYFPARRAAALSPATTLREE